ncbi:MAG: hypothetical protein N5P05_002928 [Chroococcopsis gigantea SAG 12.99]|jgi:general L-amino acid transport system permease protein|nr:ABC transporter permease subunit [Chlorogloea purpurea SAG 13.99]MDV3001322.1 hypothetical protein [Chroococcopsis gigantea SAG 12.99]
MSIWYDSRFRRLLLQGVIIILLVVILAFFGRNLILNFQRLGLVFGFGFLFDPDRPAGFAISDSPISYSPGDGYGRAVLVGLVNTLRVAILGTFGALFLGIVIGLARISNNWLVKQLSGLYVEVFRNTPLLLQLFFWYFAVFLQLPRIDNPFKIGNLIFLANSGIYLQLNSGAPFTSGLHLTSEFATLLLGLITYTAAFIGETVRGGIESIARGQWEAAKALGLKPNLVMALIIFPQALRVMIPPLTNDCLNLVKNSSLAIAIGYSDIYAVSSTIANQTGNAVEMLVVVMCTYLFLNLLISAAMNWLNSRI